MREEDREEIKASGGTPQRSLGVLITNENETYAISCPEGVVALFGINRTESGGWIWALCSDLLTDARYKVPTIRITRAIVQSLLNQTGKLSCQAWSKNIEHIKWLQWLGFKEVLREGDFITMEKRKCVILAQR